MADEIAPAAPENLVAIADGGAAEIGLTWSRPQADRSGGELTGLESYIITRSKDNASSLVAIDTVEATQTQFVDRDLEAATAYFYAVIAVDGFDNASSRSLTASAVTAGIAVPKGVVVQGRISKIEVTWDASAEEDLLGYNVYRSIRSDQGYERIEGSEGTSYTTGQTSYVDPNLIGGDILFYRITAVTGAGESASSAFGGATVQIDTQPPAAPTFIEGEPVEGVLEDLEITWLPPKVDANGGELTGVNEYTIYRSAFADGPFEEIAVVTEASFIDTGLVAQTTYYYQVNALDRDRNIGPRSATAALETGGVGIPQNVRLTASTSSLSDSTIVTIRWEHSAGAGIVRYHVERTTIADSNNDDDYVAITPTAVLTIRRDNTVVPGRTYYYRVRAEDFENRFSDWTEPLGVEVIF